MANPRDGCAFQLLSSFDDTLGVWFARAVRGELRRA
jgi:hypothetical protein